VFQRLQDLGLAIPHVISVVRNKIVLIAAKNREDLTIYLRVLS